MTKLDYSLNVSNECFAATPSTNVVCGSDTRSLDTLNLLVNDWPAVEKYMRSLSVLYTDFIYYGGTPIINIIIKSGLDAYAAKHYDLSEPRLPRDRVLAYIQSSLQRAVELSSFKIADSKKDEWTAITPDPFSVWRLGRERFEVHAHTVDSEKFMEALYKKLLPVSIKKVFKRHDYEKIILVDSLGSAV